MNSPLPGKAVVEAASGPAPGALHRVLGLGFGIAIVIGNAVSATFNTSAQVAQVLADGTLILLAWGVGGLYAFLGANAQAELGAMLPLEGGPYAYARHAYGEYGGFIVGWADWIANSAAVAAFTLLIGQSMAEIWPPVGRASGSIAAGAVIAFAALNWIGIRVGDGAQKAMSALWALVLVAFVVAAFAWRGPFPGGPAAPALAAGGHPGTLTAFLVAQRFVLYAYAGWNAPLYLAEEHRDAGRHLPRAMFGGVALMMALYLLVNAALLRVLPIEPLRSSTLPLVTATRDLAGEGAAAALVVLTVIALLGGLNANILSTPRTLFAMARDGLFARRAAAVNRGGTPGVALWITAGAILAFIASGTYDDLLSVFASVSVANDMLLVLAVFVLRRREPERPRPHRTWGYPWTPLVLLAVDLALGVGLVVGSPVQTLWALALLGCSVPAYLLVRRSRRG
jgi:APA family basic amino acid/polyamine antiporter